MPQLEFDKQATDQRGTILFLKYGDKKINIVEIKKGFARGGHYHSFESRHHIISGIIEYREKDITNNTEKIQTISGPAIIQVPPNTAHLLIAKEDTLFAEEFGRDYSATNYPPYRNIVLEKIT